MIKIADPNFLIDVKKIRGRKPLQLLHVIIDGKTFYLSDIEITVRGFSYKPWVESWGQLTDSSDINSLFGGQSIGFRVGNITIINSKKSLDFVNLIAHHGVENTKIELYQHFLGSPAPTAPILIDTFRAKDPINLSEDSMLFNFDIVSELAASNRKLFPTTPGEDNYPVVVGKVENMSVVDADTASYCILEQFIDKTTNGKVKFSHIEKLPATGTIWIDSERVGYTAKGTDTLTINRSSTPMAHDQGTLSPLNGTKFRYNVCAGKVRSITGVRVAGIDVSGKVSVSINTNPAYIEFNDGYPANYGITTKTTISSKTDNYNDVLSPVHSGPMSKVLSYGHVSTLSGPGDWAGIYCYDFRPAAHVNTPYKCNVKIKHQIKKMAADTRVRVIFGYSKTSSPIHLADITAITISEFSSKDSLITESSINVGDLNYNELTNNHDWWRFVCVIEVMEGTTAEFVCWKPKMELSYSYQGNSTETQDSIVYASESDITCTVEGLGGRDVTPPALVRDIIMEHTDFKSQIDQADFTKEINQYWANNYTFNGLLPAGIRVHDAIKIALLEGLGRLKYSQGKIQFLSYFDDDSKVVDLNIPDEHVLIKSRGIEHYSTDNIKNHIMVRYGYDLKTGEYAGVTTKLDTKSVTDYLLQEESRDLTLVNNSAVADMYCSRMLSFLKNPPKVFSVKVFFPAGYLLEKGDRIKVKSFLNNHHVVTGNVLSIKRDFGQGKSRKINMWEVLITGYETNSEINIEETIIIDSTDYDKTTIFNLPDEAIVIDSTNISEELESELSFVDSIVIDSSGVSLGATKQLSITDTILIDGVESISNKSELNIHEVIVIGDLMFYNDVERELKLVDTIVIDGKMDIERDIELLIEEIIFIDSTQSEHSTCGGYGSCGYGEKGYGE